MYQVLNNQHASESSSSQALEEVSVKYIYTLTSACTLLLSWNLTLDRVLHSSELVTNNGIPSRYLHYRQFQAVL